MAEMSLEDALEQIKNSKGKARDNAFRDLKHILQYNQSSSRLQDLNESTFRHILEPLFQCVEDERTAWLKVRNAVSRRTSASTLTKAANALRSAVEIVVPHIRSRTVQEILEHIQFVFCTPSGDFVEPLALDYAKCLRSLLTFQPHVEHLNKVDENDPGSATHWKLAVDFCVECLQKTMAETDEAITDDGPDGLADGTMSYRSSRSFVKESAESQTARSLAKHVAEEMVGSLRLLTAAPNAPMAGSAGGVSNILIRFLKKHTLSSRVAHEAFAAFNNVIVWARVENTTLTKSLVPAILRLTRLHWPVKEAGREHFLSTLLLLEPYIFHVIKNDEKLDFTADIVDLLNTIRGEYTKRTSQRDLLNLEDLHLNFRDIEEHQAVVGTNLFTLNCTGVQAESNWALLYIGASLYNALSEVTDRPTSFDGESANESSQDTSRPLKRRRLDDDLEDDFGHLVANVTDQSPATQIYALQILMFVLQSRTLTVSQLSSVMESAMFGCSEKAMSISSWSFIVLATCARQPRAHEDSFSAKWSNIWQLAVRALSNASACRAASFTLYMMLRLDLVQQSQSQTLVLLVSQTMSLNGPVVVADSVLALLRIILEKAKQTSPKIFVAAAEGVANWYSRLYLPSRFQNLPYASTFTSFQTDDMMSLLTFCLQQPRHKFSNVQYPIWNKMARVWLHCLHQRELITYLLVETSGSTSLEVGKSSTRSNALSEGTLLHVTTESLAIAHLTAEIDRINGEWTQETRETAANTSADVFTILCTAACVGVCAASCLEHRDSKLQKALERQTQTLLHSICDFYASPQCEDEKADIMLFVFSKSLSGCCQPGFDARLEMSKPSACERVLCDAVLKATTARRRNKDLNVDDLMELDSDPESQNSAIDQAHRKSSELLSELNLTYSRASLRSSITLYATAVTLVNDDEAMMRDPREISLQLTDHMLAQPEHSIICSRSVVAALPNLGITLTEADTSRYLEFFMKKIINSYAYERSEVAIGALFDFMSSTAEVWTGTSNRDLHTLGIDIYEWCTDIALSNRFFGADCEHRLAALLLRLCAINTDYGRENDVPSVRTSLFNLVQLGAISVKFFLASKISDFFGLFVLSKHETMFQDLQKILPEDVECIEGIAIRLLFLAKLAAAWHSLLRTCVYLLFETAGLVKASSRHSTICILDLASQLPLRSPQKLFGLFAPQIFYSWLDTHSLDDLPYAAFQYSSLQDLFVANESELCAQLVMRSSEEDLSKVAQALQTTSQDLVKRSFAKSLAYAVSRDLKIAAATNETYLKNLIGQKEEYKMLTRQNFPAVMGYFYTALQQHDGDNAWLDRRPKYAAASRALREMKYFSTSARTLPEGQQPSFKNNFLCDQIERLCRRTGCDPVQPWNPSSYTVAARMLLDTIDDSLGSLHACLVIRRLKILICMAGQNALEEYPLEMLIHSLRPFVVDAECADDTLGILRYLLEHGKPHLHANPTFLTGTVILLVLQMKKHSVTRQESTTQESQHIATVQKMIDFQNWLFKYLADMFTDQSSSSDDKQSTDLVQALRLVQLPGKSHKESPESALVLYLIQQYDMEQPQCSRNDCNEALAILAKDFESPQSRLDDCLGDDGDAAKYSQSLWSILRSTPLSPSFSTWAARVIGRTYVSTGVRPLSASARPGSTASELAKDNVDGVASSLSKIADRLSDLLFSTKRSDASLAEYTLRCILTSFEDPGESLAFERLLAPKVLAVVSEGCLGYVPTRLIRRQNPEKDLRSRIDALELVTFEDWVMHFAIAICETAPDVPVISALPPAFGGTPSLATELLPCVLHILLAREIDGAPVLRPILSKFILKNLDAASSIDHAIQRFFVQLLLYLRSKGYPKEATQQDRFKWLDVDQMTGALAATRCGMPLSALMLAESAFSVTEAPRRASARSSTPLLQQSVIPEHLLLTTFKEIDEPDSFYGVQQGATMESVLERLDHESDGFRSLMFRSALMDSQLQHTQKPAAADMLGMIHSFSTLNLNHLTLALSAQSTSSVQNKNSGAVLDAARKLQQWDFPILKDTGAPSNGFWLFQDLSRTRNSDRIQGHLNAAFSQHMSQILAINSLAQPSYAWCRGLAILTEASEVLAVHGDSGLDFQWQCMQQRQGWMTTARFEEVESVMTNRQTLLGVVRQNKTLQGHMHVSEKRIRMLEVEVSLETSRMARQHLQLQQSLVATASLSRLMADSRIAGLNVSGAVKADTASVLWSSGEAATAVRMLRDVLDMQDLDSQDLVPGRSTTLAQLGQWMANARLEKPETILSDYLQPAISDLQSVDRGEEAGNVYFKFASFCDAELQNAGNIENFARAQKLRQGKEDEVQELKQAIKGAKKSNDDRKELERSLNKAQKWFNIDDAEYQRLKLNQDMYIQQSLRNYLLALRATDVHDICVLRFFALWLENTDDAESNKVVAEALEGVPSWKFILLMNQLSSRVAQEDTIFQKALQQLVTRLCMEHPYHSLHHLYVSIQKPSNADLAATSRYQAARAIFQNLQIKAKEYEVARAVIRANNQYNTLAYATPEVQRGSGKIALKDFAAASKVASTIPSLHVPPLTASLPLRPDADYKSVPTVVKYGPWVSVMHGISAPKLLTAFGSDGQQYRQLFKSGNDDLRQDAIMEQVFEEVSKMLRNHKTTRQRDLKVRTYKVIPLTKGSGVIEFVPNSIPLNEFLRPAHQRYYPSDFKDHKARDVINVAAQHSTETRIKEFRRVCDHLHPVLRHFFFERFHNPDEWFARRTAYTRTTASVSMLGYILGLGDRHCHNILLDEKTGEIVHIDLGVAFEAGRVLPIPEMVPFRLTRDIIDGMGATKTEGVFRRCCEFTMEALRHDKNSIMTLLNVLRYDPLYNWTISPVRARRMQAAQDTGNDLHPNGDASALSRDPEAGEADRALSIVEKKLSSPLSVPATVNELIQQATDERNLATLFHGWAAYF